VRTAMTTWRGKSVILWIAAAAVLTMAGCPPTDNGGDTGTLNGTWDFDLTVGDMSALFGALGLGQTGGHYLVISNSQLAREVYTFGPLNVEFILDGQSHAITILGTTLAQYTATATLTQTGNDVAIHQSTQLTLSGVSQSQTMTIDYTGTLTTTNTIEGTSAGSVVVPDTTPVPLTQSFKLTRRT
jgi:hypothetical protein